MATREAVIASKRTLLRPFSTTDADELLAVFRDPMVRRYLLDDSVVSTQWMRDEIVASETRFADSGAGLWSIRLYTEPRIVGFVGFREFFEPAQLQLLYGLLPGYWGEGLATEAASRVRDHAFRELGFHEIRAAVDVPNEASAEVLLRLGMTSDRVTYDGSAGTAFYVLERESWRARRATS